MISLSFNGLQTVGRQTTPITFLNPERGRNNHRLLTAVDRGILLVSEGKSYHDKRSDSP